MKLVDQFTSRPAIFQPGVIHMRSKRLRKSVVVLAVVAAAAVAIAAPASADQGATVFRFPVVATLTSPCTGEQIAFSGTEVFVVSQFSTANVNHLAVSQAWQNMNAVSASGTMYRLMNSSMGQQQNPIPVGGGPSTSTQEFRVISQGSLDNFLLLSTQQIVVANGELVVFDQTFTTKCVG